MKNLLKAAIVSSLAIFALSILGIINLEGQTTPTGNFILESTYGVAGLSAIVFTLLLKVYWKEEKEKREGAAQTSAYQSGGEELTQIKEIMQKYERDRESVDKKANHIVSNIMPHIQKLYKERSEYFRSLDPALKNTMMDIYSSSNLNSHGHFNVKRGIKYVRDLAKELGLYDLAKSMK